MKKKIMYGTLAAAVALGSYLSLSSQDDKAETQKPISETPTKATGPETENTPVNVTYSLTAEEEAIAGKQIGEVNDEETLQSRLIVMAIQKVSIGGSDYPDTPKGTIIKSSRSEMTKGNIAYLNQQLLSMQGIKEKDRSIYEDILKRWAEGKFEN